MQDIINGNAGSDTLYGRSGKDVLFGGFGEFNAAHVILNGFFFKRRIRAGKASTTVNRLDFPTLSVQLFCALKDSKSESMMNL